MVKEKNKMQCERIVVKQGNIAIITNVLYKLLTLA